jgi:hypothetical protein
MVLAYLCSSSATTCSCGSAHRSSPAYLALHCGTGRRRHRAWPRAWWSASWPWRVLSPMSLPGAQCRRTPGAYRTSVGIFPRHPAEGNNSYLGTRSAGTRLLKATVTYIHPLLSTLYQLQVASYRCRADEIIRQKHKSIPTSRGGLGHRRRTDWLRVLDFW